MTIAAEKPKSSPDKWATREHEIESMTPDQHQHSPQSRQWWPILTPKQLLGGWLSGREGSARQIAVTTLPKEWDSVESHDGCILILNPVVNDGAADQLTAANDKHTVIATVDHYVHVEILERSAARLRNPLRVMVAIDSGAGFFGCRPGLEAIQLATVISQQDHLEFVGLTTEVRSFDGKNRSLLNPAMSALRDTQTKLSEHDLTCEFLHLTTASWPPSGVSFTLEPESLWKRSSPAFVESDTEHKKMSQSFQHADGSSRSRSFWATVVSRPSLDRAILVCDAEFTEDEPALKISSTGERLKIIDTFGSRLSIRPENHRMEFQIGQKLQLQHSTTAT